MKSKFFYPIISVLCVAASVAVLLMLLPVEKRNQLREEYGEVVDEARTDPKAAAIVENIESYPKEIISRYYLGTDEDKQFVYDYLNYKDAYLNVVYTDEELNSEEIPALYMDDPRWAYAPVRGGFIFNTGCVYLSVTMAYVGIMGETDLDPYKVYNIAESIGVAEDIGGIMAEDIDELCKAVGFDVVEYAYSDGNIKTAEVPLEELRKVLDESDAVLAGVKGGIFGTHCIVIRSCSEDGKVMINDPADVEKTEKIWDFSELETDIHYLIALNAK